MHEMGVMLHILEEVEEVARINDLEKIAILVLSIGDLTGVMPNYMHNCWLTIQARYPMFSSCELIMESVKGYGRCHACGYEFDLVEQDGHCPICDMTEYSVLSGKELIIKEIAVI